MILLLLFGGLMALVGLVWMILIAFAESVPWAVAIFFLPPVLLVYGYLRWDECKVPTILYFIGLTMFLVGRYA